MAEIPERLKANGRGEDPDFPPQEKLFRRYKKAEYQAGVLLNIALSSAPSVNRGNYSQSTDVLIHEADKYAGFGILSFLVQDIPAQLLAGQPTHQFFPKHMPVANNYSHSEVWCNRIGQIGPHVEPNKAVRKMFRTLLGQRVAVEMAATI